MHKKICMIALIICTLILSGCQKKATTPQAEMTPNPQIQGTQGSTAGGSASAEALHSDESVAAVQSDADFKQLNIELTAPVGAEKTAYSIVDNTIAQVTFFVGDVQFALRAGKGIQLTTGMFAELKDDVTSTALEINGMSTDVFIHTAEAGGKLASWTWGDVQFLLWTTIHVNDDTFASIALDTAMSSGIL